MNTCHLSTRSASILRMAQTILKARASIADTARATSLCTRTTLPSISPSPTGLQIALGGYRASKQAGGALSRAKLACVDRQNAALRELRINGATPSSTSTPLHPCASPAPPSVCTNSRDANIARQQSSAKATAAMATQLERQERSCGASSRLTATYLQPCANALQAQPTRREPSKKPSADMVTALRQRVSAKCDKLTRNKRAQTSATSSSSCTLSLLSGAVLTLGAWAFYKR
jgi:hypothetical protein